MSHVLKQLKAAILPIIGMIVFVSLLLLGFFIFSYLLIIAAIFGLILFLVTFIRSKLSRKKSDFTSSSTGRTIDHDSIQETKNLNNEKKKPR